jgi:hypothetical protein
MISEWWYRIAHTKEEILVDNGFKLDVNKMWYVNGDKEISLKLVRSISKKRLLFIIGWYGKEK